MLGADARDIPVLVGQPEEQEVGVDERQKREEPDFGEEGPHGRNQNWK